MWCGKSIWWSVARYMPTSLASPTASGCPEAKFRFHGKTLISPVEKAQALPEPLPPPLQNLIGYAGLPQVFKDIKALVQGKRARRRA
ncbi:hypothetical protein MJ579_18245 [Klebsiella pneumoniae]|nr:hypothetical protein MJ579_18245 [Klebsiella pneumoniae]